jgi:phosphatidylserine/phosphatidylglycerophosphate/cardiolipin synthase-like enzyme
MVRMKPAPVRLGLVAPLLVVLGALAACGAPPADPDPAAAAAEGPAAEQPGGQTPDPGATATTPRAPVMPACSPLVPRTTPLEVSVEPDAGARPFVAVLARATKSIRVMVYEMGTGPIIDTLEAKARAGVKVQMILDVAQMSVNQKYMDRMKAAGAAVIWSDTAFQFMHAKVLVVDEKEAVVSTGNYAAFRMNIERNYAVHDADPADVDVLVKLFDADFARKTPELTCTRLLVSPVNAKQRLLDFVASARTEIAVESMQLADDDMRNALAARRAAGVSVRVLLADTGWITANADAATFLAAHDIEARQMKSPAVHVKAVVVDGQVAYAGSINLSWTSLTKNREVGLLVTEPANVSMMHATFEKDWATATAF